MQIQAEHKHTGFLHRLAEDLIPYSGRANQVLRTVLACAIVVLISQTLMVPWLALSLVVVFFVTQTNVVVTRLTGVLFILAATLAIALSLLIIIVTWNAPLLRILSACIIFFGSVFLMRTSKLEVIFFVVAIVVAYAQSLIDIAPNAELLVRSILWVWVAVSYAIAVTVIINTLFLPIDPVKQFKRAMRGQLEVLINLLEPAKTEERLSDDPGKAGREMQSLYKLLRFSVMGDQSVRDRKQEYLAQLSLISELRAISCQLPAVFNNSADKELAHQLQQSCRLISASIADNSAFPAITFDKQAGENAALKNMATTLHNYYEDLAIHNSTAEPSKSGFLVSDAFSNPRYPMFALKTLLSAFLSYLLYAMTDWEGIHTIMLTCVIVAQPGLGNVQRKIVLRLIGAGIGSLIALGSIVFILPQLDSVFGLLMLILPVMAVSSWIATGPERISYAGIQIMFTFSLAILGAFGPVYELTEVRDRIIGIIAGIIIAGITHLLISPERESELLLSKLSKLLNLARKEFGRADIPYRRTEINSGIAECEDIASRVALEPTWMRTEGAQDIIHHKQQMLLQCVKHVLIQTDRLALIIRHMSKQHISQSEATIDLLEDRLEETFNWLEGKSERAPLLNTFNLLATTMPEELKISAIELNESLNQLNQLSTDFDKVSS
ncbi:FUSC family protein [Vibrio alginolyticus]|nr:FUSC family protein [Vibrio alginolyticus]